MAELGDRSQVEHEAVPRLADELGIVVMPFETAPTAPAAARASTGRCAAPGRSATATRCS